MLTKLNFMLLMARLVTEPLCADGLTVIHCNIYAYLGSLFTCDGSVSSAIKENGRVKLYYVLKFVSLIKKDNDVSLIVKLRVFDAANMSSGVNRGLVLMSNL